MWRFSIRTVIRPGGGLYISKCSDEVFNCLIFCLIVRLLKLLWTSNIFSLTTSIALPFLISPHLHKEPGENDWHPGITTSGRLLSRRQHLTCRGDQTRHRLNYNIYIITELTQIIRLLNHQSKLILFLYYPQNIIDSSTFAKKVDWWNIEIPRINFLHQQRLYK